jgi:hypothetical protein
MNFINLSTNKKWEGDGGTFPGMNKKGGRYQVLGGEYLYLLSEYFIDLFNFVNSCSHVFKNF